MKNIKNNITLATHIKWVIGNRIMLCLGLLSVVVLINSFSEMVNGYKQINAKLNDENQIFSQYIIAQSLIDNQAGIWVRIKELNEANFQKKFEWMPQIKVLKKEQMKWVFPFSWVYRYPVYDNDGILYGEIRVTGSFSHYNSILFQLIAKCSLLATFSIFIFFLLLPLSRRIPQDLFVIPVMNLLDLLKSRTNIESKNNHIMLPVELREVQDKITELINQLTKNANKIALGHVAAQVAHDIRSPLAALDMSIKLLTTVPADQKKLMKAAICRIHDIANNLLSFYKDPTIESEEAFPEYIVDLVLSVISEKKIQYKYNGINFDIEVKKEAYCAFSSVSASLLKRVLSNLFDNSVEAVKQKKEGLIHVVIAANLSDVFISIEDNGCGITNEILENIKAGTIATSKRHGNGLGLPHAIKAIKEVFLGEFNICSSIDIGTKINIILPRVSSPSWFASNLVIAESSTIVVLDDDILVHQMWRNRFREFNPLLKIVYFYCENELIEWYKDNVSSELLFLFDFELSKDRVVGLDIIEKLGISSCSYLVTNRYQELEVQTRSYELGVCVVPKLFAAHIPMVLF